MVILVFLKKLNKSTFMTHTIKFKKINNKSLKFFKKNGFLYIKNFYKKNQILNCKKEIFNLLQIFLDKNNLKVKKNYFSNKNFDNGLLLLTKNKRQSAGIFYDVLKKLPSLVSLATDKKVFSFSKKILETNFVGFANNSWGFRLDHPTEKKYLTNLHQEIVTQLTSMKGLVFWTPFQKCLKKMGPPIFYPNSHKFGIYQLKKNKKVSYGFSIKNEKLLEKKFTPHQLSVDEGDCLIMDYLLLHKSAFNKSNKTRWSLLMRTFDFKDKTAIKNNWPSGINSGIKVDKVFPEKVIK